MSWIENIKSELIITTGDSKQYRPLWINATKAIEYNIAEFNFPNLSGSKIDKGTPKGARYNLEIYFQGDEHLELSRAFEKSASDTRPWVVSHPYYGEIVVQPTALLFDNSDYNVSKITGTIIETITDDNPKVTFDPIDNIGIIKTSTDSLFQSAFDVTPSVSDINSMATSNSNTYKAGSKIVNNKIQAEEYFNLYNEANASIINATSEPIAAVRAIQSVISYPALFTTGVKSRIDLLSSDLKTLRLNISGITKRSSKKVYESYGSAIISAQTIAASSPLSGDYGTKNSVLQIIEILVSDYNTYLVDLDSLQTLNGGNPDSFIPDANAQLKLNELVNYTISSLFTIALNSKQERSFILEEDSNILLLTHRIYGLDPFDNNINEFIVNNDIGLNEMLVLRKGRKINYYI